MLVVCWFQGCAAPTMTSASARQKTSSPERGPVQALLSRSQCWPLTGLAWACVALAFEAGPSGLAA